ncbi:1-(5-phosphoribosyl)-5-[(5-phosphoribosylamino)methylideneamino] imidazole-4-carboxamide isomerase [Luteimonas gilva]|uniref:1-(5-phosphoribosyl)-5-[(5-phosphoribosylamino)methylideneamino] imidazole-4-carboxamide isomerase n=1 Tax=Luteimonas gilva TaxID=2572684 RepID=A0A4U5JXT6_9GAMM|nr:1-(5-phosphoribosyl)-5-[(5-phosphoribosylamino)methylideneamino] imidazole-4-carboxamide isomerase [Luteimonas gilva]TKR33037.1 1-(5-phosphoribosyl)-5-[(5-phosphoribosylamino)methylideneamino] imidazole-4-carboxamide isomerase [Luteimonas gilva]
MTARTAFQVYPAIDVRGGRVVRLAQGDYARETPYAQDPLALARAYAAAGADWLHLVDLDAARDGGYGLSSLATEIKAQTRLSLQTGGGVREESDIERLLAAGADRIVVGSLSVNEPHRVEAWLRRYGNDKITVALDARRTDDGRWFPATHGWTRQSERSLADVVRFYAHNGLRHLLCTDIARDGMLSGPNFPLYALLRQWAPQVAVQASGGARDLGDVREARRAGCAGIVLGKSLLEGRVGLAEALAC